MSVTCGSESVNTWTGQVDGSKIVAKDSRAQLHDTGTLMYQHTSISDNCIICVGIHIQIAKPDGIKVAIVSCEFRDSIRESNPKWQVSSPPKGRNSAHTIESLVLTLQTTNTFYLTIVNPVQILYQGTKQILPLMLFVHKEGLIVCCLMSHSALLQLYDRGL